MHKRRQNRPWFTVICCSELLDRTSQPEVLVYSNTEGTNLSLDFYRPQSQRPAPLLVMIHGGSWVSGDNKDFIALDQYLAGRGFAVADVLYRLAPKSRYPAASDDVREAIGYLQHHAESLRIDPRYIVLIGRSAGGQIALNVAYSANDPAIRGVVSFYGPADLTWSWENPGNPLVIDTRGRLTDFLGGSPSEAASNYDSASPVRFVTPRVPPTLLLHGGRDELVALHHSNVLERPTH